jgi:hypothetical protein
VRRIRRLSTVCEALKLTRLSRLFRLYYRDASHARLSCRVHNHNQSSDVGIIIRLNDDRGSRVFGFELVNVRANLCLNNRPRITIEDNLIVRPDFEQDVSLLLSLLAALIDVSERNVAVTTKKIRRMNTTSSIGVRSILVSSDFRLPAIFFIIMS